MSEVLQNLANSDTFTTLDCMAGFWQISLDEDSKEKTAFSTREGHFHFNVLPFGLKDAGNSFERAAMAALADLVGNTVLVYLDDLIICSKGTEEHFRKLRKVLEKLRAANFTLKLSKCELFRSELSFLGHRVSKDGLSVEESKKLAIRNCETPKDKEALKSFLGLMGFYRNFVPRFSHTAESLLKLLRKSSKFIWEEEQENAYQQLKAALLEPPILKYPDYSKTFFVVTDASQVGLGHPFGCILAWCVARCPLPAHAPQCPLGIVFALWGQSLMKWLALQRKHIIVLLLDDTLLAPLPRLATPRPLCGKLLLYGGIFDDTAATISLEYFSSISALSTTVLILPGDELVWTSPYQPGCNVLLLSLAISSSEQLTFMLSITFLDNWTMLGFVSCSSKIVFSATLRGTVALVIVTKANLLRAFFKSGIWATGV